MGEPDWRAMLAEDDDPPNMPTGDSFYCTPKLSCWRIPNWSSFSGCTPVLAACFGDKDMHQTPDLSWHRRVRFEEQTEMPD
ncbi:hypothetical protein [Escherichia coli]|uniref:hypothetical protein n=1 Tax=Escherichia coli TaxID=562 RepID=UPI0022262EFF|nr:hypothetical protein [Escherichia coli]MCW3365106.1 hypothetical protein [Escherichia coli]